MYSESDIEAAIAAGAITPEAAAALRDSVARGRATPAVDEESFRLLTGFNDIFVTIAAILLLVAVGWIGSSIGRGLVPVPPFAPPGPEYVAAFGRMLGAEAIIGGLGVSATSWLLAEYFTRRRRMALPSIVLLATFALSAAAVLQGIEYMTLPGASVQTKAFGGAVIALVTAGLIYLHWRRFHVPITIAALTGALVATLVSLFLAAVPAAQSAWLWVLLAAGIGVFAFAMWWDMSDRARQTRRSDVAFWLHLAAAPMIAHPVFWLLGVMNGTPSAATALVVIALYILFGVIALAVDRRALLVSSLVYVLYALAGLFRQFGAVSLAMALTALVIGSALLTLSAFWHPIRRLIVDQLPDRWRERLPELDRALIPRPA